MEVRAAFRGPRRRKDFRLNAPPPLVSIGIPAYNRETLLVRAIESAGADVVLLPHTQPERAAPLDLSVGGCRRSLGAHGLGSVHDGHDEHDDTKRL